MEELNKIIFKKLDNIDERLDSVDKRLEVYNAQLEYHIKRTDLMQEDLDPIKAHVIQVTGITKFLGFTIVISSVIISLLTYLYK